MAVNMIAVISNDEVNGVNTKYPNLSERTGQYDRPFHLAMEAQHFESALSPGSVHARM